MIEKHPLRTCTPSHSHTCNTTLQISTRHLSFSQLDFDADHAKTCQTLSFSTTRHFARSLERQQVCACFWMRRGGTRGGENTTATWTARWHRHIEWQRQLLVNLAAGKTPPRAPRFLVLRPGDKLTVCDASGMHDLRGQCYRGTPPSRRRPLDGEHWDAFMTSGNAKLMRPLPGLGNVALSLVSAAITAVVSRRVLLLENFSAPSQSFGSPMRDLILESNGWAPHMAEAAQLGGMTDSWAAHDDQSAFADLCRANLRSWPPSRVWRIWSNQYFAPLLLLNPHHALHVEAMAVVFGAQFLSPADPSNVQYVCAAAGDSVHRERARGLAGRADGSAAGRRQGGRWQGCVRALWLCTRAGQLRGRHALARGREEGA